MSAVADLIKPDARHTVKNIVHSVGISAKSAHNILTQQLKLIKLCARCAPIAWLKNKMLLVWKCSFIFLKIAKIDTNQEYQNYLQLMEPGYTNLSPRVASIISSSRAKTKLGLSSQKNKKRGKKFHMPYVWILIYPLFRFMCQSTKIYG